MSEPTLTAAQKAAVLADARDTLVTAGAGTGKTTVLVQRVLHRLRAAASPSLEGLLVVTFTDKAAREMRERIHRELRGDPKLRHLLPQLPRATISTIHAFCARFLRERFLEAGLEPGFRVLDESAAAQAFSDALGRAFHDWYQHRDPKLRSVFCGMVEMSGFDPEGEGLRHVVRRLHAFARTTDDPALYLDSLLARTEARAVEDLPWHAEMCRGLWGQGGRWREGLWTRGVRLYRAALDLAAGAGKKVDAHERLYRILTEGQERLLDPVGQAELQSRLEEGGFGRKAGGIDIDFPRAPNGANAIPGFQLLYGAAKRAFDEPLVRAIPWDPIRLLDEGRKVRAATGALVQLVRDVEDHYEAFKRRGGFLDFADLEIRTLELLRKLGDRALGIYRESLVDEFQDVNRLQEAILARLVPAEARFRVGDVKQSIYQFRLADPTIFLGLMEGRRAVRAPEELAATEGPVTVFLGENHRSRPEIVEFTNLVFGRLFEAEQIGSAYAEQALVAARERPAPPAPVEVHVISKGEDGPTAALERQARLAARRLRAMVLDERTPVARRDGSVSPATWRDAAVLLRAANRAELFRRVFFEEGVPAYLGAGGSLLEEEVAQDFRSLLQVIDNPRDDIALASLMRSPLFCVTDADLLRLRLARPATHNLIDAVTAEAFRDEPGAAAGVFSPAAMGTALAGDPVADARELIDEALARRLREFLRRLRGWRDAAGMRGLGDLLRAVAAESGLLARLQGMGDHASHRAALEKLLALADAFESERGPSLHGFLARLEGLQTHGGIEGVPLLGEGEDAVTILSVHKAKGLEFPLVVLPQLDWGFRPDRLGARIRVDRGWIGTRSLNAEDWSQEDSWARRMLEVTQQRSQREEEARILYVALTRARERLVLLGSVSRSWQRQWPPADRSAAESCLREMLRGAGSCLGWLLSILSDVGWGAGNPSFVFAEHAADAPEVCALPVALGEGARAGAVASAVHPPGAEPGAKPRPEPGGETRGQPVGEPDGGWAGISQDEPRAENGARAGDHPGPAVREPASAALDALLRRIGRAAPFPPLAALGSAGLRAKYWVTELKTLADAERRRELEAEGAESGWPASSPASPAGHDRAAVPPAGSAASSPASAGANSPADSPASSPAGSPAGSVSSLAEAAARRGLVYHTALSRLDLTAASPAEIERQFDRFATEPWWRGVPRDSRIEAGIARFFATPAGRALSEAAATPESVEREVPFSLKMPVRCLLALHTELRQAIETDPRWAAENWSRALDESWVLVQGRIDCLFRCDGRWSVLDWKTDQLGPGEIAERARAYEPQIRLYRQAVRELWGDPGRAWVVFVAEGQAVETGAPDAAG